MSPTQVTGPDFFKYFSLIIHDCIMQQIHVRNVFQLFIPLSLVDQNKFSVTHATNTNVGLVLHNKETSEYWQYDIRLFSNCEDEKKRLEQDQSAALVWAKRNPYQLLNSGDNFGIILRLKIQHNVFDFRKVKKITIRFHVTCFSSGVLIGQATSSPVTLLPKKRQATTLEFPDEVTVPMVWMQELQPVLEEAQNNNIGDYMPSSDQLSSEDASNQYLVPWSSDLEAPVIQHIGEYPTEDYPIQNYEYNSNNEQYMVLYNGDAEVIGNFRALNFYKASDIRIKEDVRLLSEDRDSRNILLKIDGVEYKFKHGVTSETQRKFVGFIAQQIEAVVPEAVQLIDGVLHVDYQSIIPYLSESIKQNFNDIKLGRSERDQIKVTVDLLYEEYILREKNKNQPSKTPQPSVLESQKNQLGSRSIPRILLFIVIGAVIISSLAIGSYFVYKRIFPDKNPPSTDPTPLAPSFNAQTDRKALIDFYIATNGGSWNVSTSWVTELPTCQWFGITCSNDSRVTQILLNNNYLTGTLSASIVRLDQLKKLQLKGNYISGIIPTLPASLDTVDLSGNQFTGDVPEFTNSKFLKLDLSNNVLNGTMDKLKTLPSILGLYLQNNALHGSVVLSSSALIGLQMMDLSNNQLEFAAADLVQPDHLVQCNLTTNSFRCPIPSWMINSCHATCT